MIKKYVDELNELKSKMEKAEVFATKVPLFEDKIINNKYTGEEQSLNFGYRYKSIPLRWGINRNHYVSGTNVTITNDNEEYDKYLFDIYFNSVSLFNEYEDFGLEEAVKDCNIYFYDEVYHIFYVEDEHIEEVLEALNTWYEKVSKNLKNIKIDKKIQELEEELSNLKKLKLEGTNNENIAI